MIVLARGRVDLGIEDPDPDEWAVSLPRLRQENEERFDMMPVDSAR